MDNKEDEGFHEAHRRKKVNKKPKVREPEDDLQGVYDKRYSSPASRGLIETPGGR
jgi:hypothetical protein